MKDHLGREYPAQRMDTRLNTATAARAGWAGALLVNNLILQMDMVMIETGS